MLLQRQSGPSSESEDSIYLLRCLNVFNVPSSFNEQMQSFLCVLKNRSGQMLYSVAFNRCRASCNAMQMQASAVVSRMSFSVLSINLKDKAAERLPMSFA